MPKCLICKAKLTDENWYPSLKSKNSKRCKACNLELSNKWRKDHPETSRKYFKDYYKRNPKRNLEWCQKNRIKIRKEMIETYGGKCSRCGIVNPIVLDIDHIKNDGGKSRKAGMWGWRLYRWLKKHNYPKDNFQLLCRNCNWIKEMKRREK